MPTLQAHCLVQTRHCAKDVDTDAENILFADHLGGQGSGCGREFKRIMKEDANTLVLNLPKNCTDEVQPGKTYPLKTCLLHLHLIYGHCRKCRLCCCRVREGGVSGSCASVSCFLTPCATPLRLSFPRNDPLTPELCVRADGFADGARLRRHVCAVRSSAGASAFRALAHPFFHAPAPFVCSKPRTNLEEI